MVYNPLREDTNIVDMAGVFESKGIEVEIANQIVF